MTIAVIDYGMGNLHSVAKALEHVTHENVMVTRDPRSIRGASRLVLPGQGILTLLIALMVSTFPGKYRMERAIMRRPRVLRAANWIRRRYHKPELNPPRDTERP